MIKGSKRRFSPAAHFYAFLDNYFVSTKILIASLNLQISFDPQSLQKLPQREVDGRSSIFLILGMLMTALC